VKNACMRSDHIGGLIELIMIVYVTVIWSLNFILGVKIYTLDREDKVS
jgi:hypothetical protein